MSQLSLSSPVEGRADFAQGGCKQRPFPSCQSNDLSDFLLVIGCRGYLLAEVAVQKKEAMVGLSHGLILGVINGFIYTSTLPNYGY